MINLKDTPARKQWDSIGIRQHHGIVVPLFSLHSSYSCGIGEFFDLIPLFSWCKSVNLDTIQLLPMNDTGQETSPYSALSAFALNPIYLSFQQLPLSQENPTLQTQISELQKLTKSQRINYQEVLKRKMQFLRQYFKIFSSKEDSKEFNIFKNSNKYWCYNYALFKAQKIKTSWSNWENWPSSLPLDDDMNREIEFHMFVQYLCFQQFQQVKHAADEHKIMLKGDIPILINRQSADVWKNHSFFLLDYSAGAPPDMYSETGQKWGFPLYNWETLASDNYQWWVERLLTASQFYHLYRLDHVVGFFRIWAIPIALPSKEGFYAPQEEDTWVLCGENILRMMLDKCPMLPIGEDLGTVPPPVRVSLANLGICGTKVMRWERNWDGDMGYILPEKYPEISMTTVSTHDSETLGQWWEESPEESKLFAEAMNVQYKDTLTSEMRKEILKISHHTPSLFHINLLNEYLAMFPDMVWRDPQDERINIPGTITNTNWTYRFKPSVEEITSSKKLADAIRECVTYE